MWRHKELANFAIPNADNLSILHWVGLRKKKKLSLGHMLPLGDTTPRAVGMNTIMTSSDADMEFSQARISPVGESSLYITLLGKFLQISTQRFLKTTSFPSLDGSHIRALPGLSCLPQIYLVYDPWTPLLLAAALLAIPVPVKQLQAPVLCKQGRCVFQPTQHECTVSFHYSVCLCPTEEIFPASFPGTNTQTPKPVHPAG